MLRAEVERDAVTAHMHVPLPQGRDSEGLRRTRIALGADAEPGAVDQPRRDRRDTLAIESVAIHVFRHRKTKIRQSFRELDQAVELRLLLLCTELGVVEVLPPPGGV